MYDETVIEGLKRLDREVNDMAISKAIGRIEELEAGIKRLTSQQPSTADLAVFLCQQCYLATDMVYQRAGGGRVCAECFAKKG